MSVFILLGLIVTMFWLISEMKMHFASATRLKIEHWMCEDNHLKKILLKTLGLSLILASPKEQIRMTMMGSNEEALSRKGLLQICMVALGFCWVLVFGLLATSVNPLYLFVVLLFLFIIFSIRSNKNYFKSFAYFALFSLVMESLEKQLSLFTDVFENSEVLFLLTDNRWGSLFFIMLLGLVISYFYKSEGLLSFFSLILVQRGWISMNGAWLLMLADFHGSLYSVLFPEFFRSMKAHQTLRKKILSDYIGFSTSSLVCAVFLYIILRSEFVFVIDTGLMGAHRSLELLIWSSVFLIVHFVMLMSWGHFKEQQLKLSRV